MGWRRNNKDGSKRKGDRNDGKSLGTGNIPEGPKWTWGRGNEVDLTGVLGQGGQEGGGKEVVEI